MFWTRAGRDRAWGRAGPGPAHGPGLGPARPRVGMLPLFPIHFYVYLFHFPRPESIYYHVAFTSAPLNSFIYLLLRPSLIYSHNPFPHPGIAQFIHSYNLSTYLLFLCSRSILQFLYFTLTVPLGITTLLLNWCARVKIRPGLAQSPACVLRFHVSGR